MDILGFGPDICFFLPFDLDQCLYLARTFLLVKQLPADMNIYRHCDLEPLTSDDPAAKSCFRNTCCSQIHVGDITVMQRL